MHVLYVSLSEQCMTVFSFSFIFVWLIKTINFLLIIAAGAAYYGLAYQMEFYIDYGAAIMRCMIKKNHSRFFFLWNFYIFSHKKGIWKKQELCRWLNVLWNETIQCSMYCVQTACGTIFTFHCKFRTNDKKRGTNSKSSNKFSWTMYFVYAQLTVECHYPLKCSFQLNVAIEFARCSHFQFFKIFHLLRSWISTEHW